MWSAAIFVCFVCFKLSVICKLAEYVQEYLVPDKLHFFISVAKLLKPLWEMNQTMPFIATDLQDIFVFVLSRLIKRSVLDGLDVQEKISSLLLRK